MIISNVKPACYLTRPSDLSLKKKLCYVCNLFFNHQSHFIKWSDRKLNELHVGWSLATLSPQVDIRSLIQAHGLYVGERQLGNSYLLFRSRTSDNEHPSQTLAYNQMDHLRLSCPDRYNQHQMGQQWLLDTYSNLVFHSGKNLRNFLCDASYTNMSANCTISRLS